MRFISITIEIRKKFDCGFAAHFGFGLQSKKPLFHIYRRIKFELHFHLSATKTNYRIF